MLLSKEYKIFVNFSRRAFIFRGLMAFREIQKISGFV